MCWLLLLCFEKGDFFWCTVCMFTAKSFQQRSRKQKTQKNVHIRRTQHSWHVWITPWKPRSDQRQECPRYPTVYQNTDPTMWIKKQQQQMCFKCSVGLTVWPLTTHSWWVKKQNKKKTPSGFWGRNAIMLLIWNGILWAWTWDSCTKDFQGTRNHKMFV